MSARVVPITLSGLLAPGESARPIPGASRYWATDLGRVVSTVNGARVLRLFRHPKGYLHAEVWRDADRDPSLPARWQAYAHELVAAAFIGARPSTPGVAFEIDHLDGDKSNNRPTNLEYVTKSENLQRAIATGRNPAVKLTAVDVWTYRCRAHEVGDADVARQAAGERGMTLRAVRDALAGRTWGSVPHPASRPGASALARTLLLDDVGEARRLLTLSPFSEGYTPDGGPSASRVLPFRSSAGPRAA